MENYPISPEDCLILRAFKSVKSLREAAQVLNCDPAGLTRKVSQISRQYGLIQKVENRWKLTAKGIDIVAWTEASILSQKQVFNDRGQCRIASTMWLNEVLLIPHFRSLDSLFDSKTSFSFHVPENSFEKNLIEGSADFAIVCHAPETPEIEHRRIITEEWIVAVPKSYDLKKIKSIDHLCKKTFIRHSQLNTDLFIENLAHKLMNESMMIDHIIGIRAAMLEGLGWSIVPKISIKTLLEKGELKEFSIQINTSDRHICLWWLRHNRQAMKAAPKIQSWLKNCLQ